MDFKIFAFRAVDEPDLCNRYVKGHIKVLTDYGITNITSNNDTWIKNPYIYCIGLADVNNNLLGGIRIQLADGINPLPVEEAIGYIDNNIYSMVDKYAIDGGVGELSGLWVDNSLKGLGFGPHLVRASIASSNQLNFKTLIGICAGYSLKMFNQVGFMIDKSLGKKGDFPYPNEKYIAHVVGILNAITLESAADFDKEIMTSLRNNNNQKNKNDKVNISYSLTYPNVVTLNYKKLTENNLLKA
ncbi:MAG: GNAT family N-acetyltransferase [Vicingaceae bacterium]|mgnify:CR=1 FL=1